jgi:hypothetical protein
MENEHTNIVTKKERIELERSQKQKAQERTIQIKQMKAGIPWILFIGFIVGVTYWAFSVAKTANENRPGEKVVIMNQDHVAPGGAADVVYNSNPPTSGSHSEAAPWGFNVEEILDENAIHNLEHGGIWISYKNLDEDAISTLKNIAKRNSASVVVSPRAANDANIAVASWGRVMKLDAIDEEAINQYIRKNKNKSPEPIAR